MRRTYKEGHLAARFGAKKEESDPHQEITREMVISAAEKLDFDKHECPKVKQFKDEYRQWFNNEARLTRVGENGNILHQLAKHRGPSKRRLQSFLKWVLDKYWRLLEVRTSGDGGYYPLHIAFKDPQNIPFIKAVLTHEKLLHNSAVLKQVDQQSQFNYLQLAAFKGSIVMRQLAELCADRRELWVAKNTIETPLHIASWKVHDFFEELDEVNNRRDGKELGSGSGSPFHDEIAGDMEDPGEIDNAEDIGSVKEFDQCLQHLLSGKDPSTKPSQSWVRIFVGWVADIRQRRLEDKLRHDEETSRQELEDRQLGGLKTESTTTTLAAKHGYANVATVQEPTQPLALEKINPEEMADLLLRLIRDHQDMEVMEVSAEYVAQCLINMVRERQRTSASKHISPEEVGDLLFDLISDYQVSNANNDIVPVEEVICMLLYQIRNDLGSAHAKTGVSPDGLDSRLVSLIKTTQISMIQRPSQQEIVALCLQYGKEALLIGNSYEPRVNPDLGTPYQDRISFLEEAWKSLLNYFDHMKLLQAMPLKEKDVALRRVIIEDPVASNMRSCCIHSFSREDIAKCLYRPGEERHIDFDLAGLPNRSISRSFLDRLGEHLQFESILKYVALPQLVADHSRERMDKDPGKSPRVTRRSALSDLREVFQWLRDKNVRTIIKAIVIDYGASHSDEIIEEALKGFRVQEWDWKKADLCTDVISTCSRDVRAVTMYSSGNNAVLKGWASDQGLACKEKFPKLERVRLFIRLGTETENRRQSNIRAFKERVEKIKLDKRSLTTHCSKRFKDHVTVEYFLDDGEVSYAEGFANNEGHVPQDVKWIRDLGELALFLGGAPRKLRPGVAPVKIAIIDDGVDASLDILKGKIAGGKSFCPYSTSADLMNAYYVPSGRHGTMMADLICRVCPSCQLYVARLDERPSRLDMTRQITVSSAVKAIQWAVDCGVDIISMSWTIEASKDDDIGALEKALQAASDANIIMFCATNDQGSIGVDTCYPKGEKVIRIGAATAKGDRCTWVTEGQYDYLLPGKNIPFRIQHPDDSAGKTTSYESGSSFATALASGLGSSLLYCERLVGQHGEPSFRSKAQMSAAFGKMTVSTINHKFIRADSLVNWFYKALLRSTASTNGQSPERDLGTANHANYRAEALAAAGSITNEAKPLSRMSWDDNTPAALRGVLSDIKDSDSVPRR